MNDDDASSVPSGELPKSGTSEAGTTEAGRSRSGGRSKGPKRSGTFVYPLPSTPIPSSTPMTVLTTGETPVCTQSTATRPAGWAPEPRMKGCPR